MSMHPYLLRAFQQYQENHGWRHGLGELNVTNKQGVCHNVALPFTLKSILRQEELWKLKYFNMQKYNLQKIL
jgi:hypothetical protein